MHAVCALVGWEGGNLTLNFQKKDTQTIDFISSHIDPTRRVVRGKRRAAH